MNYLIIVFTHSVAFFYSHIAGMLSGKLLIIFSGLVLVCGTERTCEKLKSGESTKCKNMPAVDAFDLTVTCINTRNAQLEWNFKQENVKVFQLNIEFTCYNYSSGSPLGSTNVVVSGEYDKNSVEPVNVNGLLISENGYCTFRACVLASSDGDICYLINKEYVNCSYSDLFPDEYLPSPSPSLFLSSFPSFSLSFYPSPSSSLSFSPSPSSSPSFSPSPSSFPPPFPSSSPSLSPSTSTSTSTSTFTISFTTQHSSASSPVTSTSPPEKANQDNFQVLVAGLMVPIALLILGSAALGIFIILTYRKWTKR